MSFTVQTSLDTKVPNVIELLGPPSATVVHQISGTLRLQVQKAIQLKQLAVTFVGEAFASNSSTMRAVRNDPITLQRIETQAIKTTTLYQPGDYTIPFQISIPGNISTTDCSQLKTVSLIWGYELITVAVPSSLLGRRKTIRQPITFKRLLVPQSDLSDTRYSAKRPNEIECSMFVPKFMSATDTKISARVFMHPLTPASRVKSVVAMAIQQEKISIKSNNIAESDTVRIGGIIDDSEPTISSDTAKTFSNTVTLTNPDQEEFSAAWGREFPIELDLDILPNELVATETLDWVKITHGVRFTIEFADSTVRNLVVMAPIQVGNVLDEPWSLQAEPDGSKPPGYGDEESVLLDSNTSRVSRNELHRALYPERVPLVPDLAGDLPPMYDYEDEKPAPYSRC
ncbi:hypothetical protein BGZ97_007653 [Linnemannia gamsii]|uniref:Arrestin-like N-terminal domain-containing protein n=1 Tax=Linnemannia gamsii TaxID=64522 RepID=A0A9P6RCX1_9FUNG|nr:hypothetical protein BGZ97_007653 [Linnemannia gamsii]